MLGFCMSFFQQAADANSKKDTQNRASQQKIGTSYFDRALELFACFTCLLGFWHYPVVSKSQQVVWLPHLNNSCWFKWYLWTSSLLIGVMTGHTYFVFVLPRLLNQSLANGVVPMLSFRFTKCPEGGVIEGCNQSCICFACWKTEKKRKCCIISNFLCNLSRLLK